ncbi:sigma-70 family RNA polymerase sigma factor [Zhongshania sp.]|jgi:RNA polymerase sigma-70 factor (ECF subfamily)|uniref:RNA polymerase sigma factor n=1 Tax=Zhongshania sp. TaxID=1971902 RepID=UPI002A824BAC|nr:sigma-70 family RNA polymerase sigma factor [Zhongshania sp.]|tara:strand:- start:14889 stop:15440 length:552 start_codon:yes stop_codon:yes gene_type:complete
MNNAEVDALIVDLQAGGAQRKHAVTQLYTEFSGKFTRFLQLRGVPESESEDLMHDIFLAFIKRCDGFTPSGQGRGWLWSVVRSKLADRYRQASKENTETYDDNWEIESGSYDEARLQACIAGQMSVFTRDYPEGAQALSWVIDDELDLRSVAELLGRSYGATREFMSQIRSRLRAYIDRCLLG